MPANVSSLCVLALDPGRLAEAEKLARTLRLPLIQDQQLQGFSFALVLTADRLELHTLGEKPPGPVSAELCDGDIRRRILGGRRQPLARACGLHRDGPLRVLDATAGLGRDGIVLAGLGCDVTMLERSPVVASLLQDALTRAASDAIFGAWLGQRVRFLALDAKDYLSTGQARAHDVVYLDPMYPHRDKRALAKKEMQALRTVAGDDADADQLLQLAIGHAMRRVVVKRPPWAKPLAGQSPDHQLTGNRARYDVYFTRKDI